MASTQSNIVVTVVIVSYNTCELTLRCLEAVCPQIESVGGEIIVVDNASGDDSVQKIRDRFPNVQVVESAENLGFGPANNVGFAHARGSHLLLLNSDAFVQPGAVAALVAYLRSHPTVGVVGPRLLNADGSTQRSCFRYPTPGLAWLENLGISRLFPPRSRWGDYRRWAHDQQGPVEWAVGACLLVRREAYEQVGGFDPRFFMYAEETDWQKRIVEAGWEIHFSPSAEVVHLGGASGASDRPRINGYFFDSLDRYMLKHHGRAGLVLLRLAMSVGSAVRAAGWALVSSAPSLRERAMAKLRLHTWLVRRQLFHWTRIAP